MTAPLAKWLARYRSEGPDGRLDRSSVPTVVANRTDERRIEVIAALRRLRMTGPEIAECLGMALSTVSGILTRIGLGKLGRIGLEPAQHYERARPGELLHVDVRRSGGSTAAPANAPVTAFTEHYSGQRTDAEGRIRKIVGWEYVHVAIDDATRLAHVEVLADEKATTAVAFLRRAVKHYARTASRSSDSSPTTARPTARPSTRSRAARSTSDTPHPPLPTPNQRQGRTVHTHATRRLGIRSDLPLKRRTQRLPRRLDRLVQPRRPHGASATSRPSLASTN